MATRTVAVTRTKNEADIIASSIRRMCAQVDHVIVGDGSNEDDTLDILQALAAEGLPLTVLTDDEPTYAQAEQMTALAHRARLEHGADWVVPFDADEVWMASEGTISEQLADLPRRILIASAMLHDHIVTSEDPDEGSPFERMVWRRTEPLPLRKVAVRARPDLQLHMGQHSASFDGVRHAATVTDQLGVRHFPYRSVEQFTRKITVGGPPLVASGLPEAIGAHWRMYYEMWERGGDDAMRSWFERWVFETDPGANPHLALDPLPPLA